MVLSTELLERLALSYSSGVLAAVSPCVIVLVPLAMYRFVNEGGHGGAKAHASPTAANGAAHAIDHHTANGNGNGYANGHTNGHANGTNGHAKKAAAPPSHWKELSWFVLGFQLSYLLFGFVLSRVLTSSIQNGFRLGLGALFITVCLLSVTHHLDPLRLPLFGNTFVMGMSFALLVSFNPCTVPFLGVVISLNTTDAMLCLTAFGQGLLTPSLIFVAVGRRFTRCLKRGGRGMALINTAMGYLLGLSGLYLMLDRHLTQALAMAADAVLPAAVWSGASAHTLASSTRILSFGDHVVMSVMWAFSALLAVHSMEAMDLTHRRIWASASQGGGGVMRSRFLALMTGLCIVCISFAGTCSLVFGHNDRAHSDWESFLTTVVSVADTKDGSDAEVAAAAASSAASGSAAPAAASGMSSAPCVDTSGLHCDGCAMCLYTYCGLVGALAVAVLYVHCVLWPRWYATPKADDTPAAESIVTTPVVDAPAAANETVVDATAGLTTMPEVSVARSDVD